MAFATKEESRMKPWMHLGSRALALALGAAFACADDHHTTTPAETTGDTDQATTTTSATTSTGSDTSTDTTVGIHDLAPWHGMWYALDPQFTVNEPLPWGNGGDGLGFMLFELRSDSAVIRVKSCPWGNSEYEYSLVEEDGVVVLDPVGGEHKYLPRGEIERMYIDPGANCSILTLRVVEKGSKDSALFDLTSIKRGELCLQCAPTQGTQGVISDCGTPVPWECPG